MNNFYKILGVSQNADLKEIKQNYRTLARQHHPDRGGNAETFKKINEAYQSLSDSQKRAEYDASMNRSDFDDLFQSLYARRHSPEREYFNGNSISTSIKINGLTKTVTTVETKNGVTTKRVVTSNIFSF